MSMTVPARGSGAPMPFDAASAAIPGMSSKLPGHRPRSYFLADRSFSLGMIHISRAADAWKTLRPMAKVAVGVVRRGAGQADRILVQLPPQRPHVALQVLVQRHLAHLGFGRVVASEQRCRISS